MGSCKAGFGRAGLARVPGQKLSEIPQFLTHV